MSDPAKYRTKEELQKMRVDHDPIEQLRQVLINNKLMDDEAFKALDKEIKEVVIDAADFAQTSPQPDPSELWTDIIIAA